MQVIFSAGNDCCEVWCCTSLVLGQMRNEARIYQMSRLQNQVAPLISQTQGETDLDDRVLNFSSGCC